MPRSSSRTRKVSNTLFKVVPYRKGFGCKRNDKDNVGTPGATNEVATLKEAVSAAERTAAVECAGEVATLKEAVSAAERTAAVECAG